MNYTIEAIKSANHKAGFSFFEPSAMRFFASRIGKEVYQGKGGVYFVTSEQLRSRGRVDARRYSVAQFLPGSGGTARASEFQEFVTLAQAKTHAKKCASREIITVTEGV